MARIRAFLCLSGPDRILLLRALVWVLVARLAVAVLPFGRVDALVRTTARARPRAVRVDPARAGWAVARVAAVVPGATCLTQAVAARMVLGGSDRASRLVIGVRRIGGVVQAHAWVVSGSEMVVGHRDDLDSFVPLSVPDPVS
ncbi:MAG: lasso peptide biosynthesis B2 protein [Actinomycetota bacterium]